MKIRINRRSFCTIAGGAVASLALSSACRHSWANQSNDGRLKARPKSRTGAPTANRTPDAPATATIDDMSIGKPVKLGLDRERDALLYIPKSATKPPLPLLLFLHGATQSADDMFWYLDSAPEETGVAILAPNSRDTTWDAITGNFGLDVEFLNRALERVFKTVTIDPARVAVGGFSDGATYAIALGLINADLFKRVAAFSPGFLIEGAPHGKPRFFISHGTRDRILPIDRCGRRVANDLKSRGYEVTFREFDGRHEIPGEVMREGLRWMSQ
jgi:phospholipase/carboxylesterase